MCQSIVAQIWQVGSCFYMLNGFSEWVTHSLLGFRKYHFRFWGLRIAKIKKKLAFLKTYRPWYDKWLARYVFVFFIFSFLMQILNSLWINSVIFFLLFSSDFCFNQLRLPDKNGQNGINHSRMLVTRDIVRDEYRIISK